MPGPPPKPTKLKLLEGNPGKRKLNDSEPEPLLGCDPPKWLPLEVLREWTEHAPRLLRLGLLTEVDGPALVALCTLQARQRQLIQLTTSDTPVSTSALVELSRELRGLWARFGMTPADRSRVKIEKAPPKSKLERFRASS